MCKEVFVGGDFIQNIGGCNVVYTAEDLLISGQEVIFNADDIISFGPPDNPPKSDTAEDKKCFCDRELTVEEVKSFYGNKKLFSASNCSLPENSKNYDEFTKAINDTLKKYEINTCIRKAHFLAQIEAETGFNTTLEYADGWDYDHTTHYDAYLQYQKEKDPKKKAKLKRGYNRYLECIAHGHDVKGYGPKYKGRGLIQTTWKDTYEKYFKYLGKPELITTPEVIANNLTYTCDSAGWYWRKNSAWGDLNRFADEDDFISICVGVNGGLNGFQHRKKNLKTILKFMNIPVNCASNKLKIIGEYKYETSNIRNSNWGKNKNNKNAIQKFDD